MDGELLIVMELADTSLHDLFEEYTAAGAAGHPAGDAARLPGGRRRRPRPHDREAQPAAPGREAEEPVPDRRPREGGRLRAGAGGERGEQRRHDRRHHAGVRRPGDVRQQGVQALRPVQPGGGVRRAADRAAAVQRAEHPPVGHAAHDGAAGPVGGAGARPAGPAAGAGQEPGRAVPDLLGVRPRDARRPGRRTAATAMPPGRTGRRPDHPSPPATPKPSANGSNLLLVTPATAAHRRHVGRDRPRPPVTRRTVARVPRRGRRQTPLRLPAVRDRTPGCCGRPS